jgi:hypothetical protein
MSHQRLPAFHDLVLFVDHTMAAASVFWLALFLEN